MIARDWPWNRCRGWSHSRTRPSNLARAVIKTLMPFKPGVSADTSSSGESFSPRLMLSKGDLFRTRRHSKAAGRRQRLETLAGKMDFSGAVAHSEAAITRPATQKADITRPCGGYPITLMPRSLDVGANYEHRSGTNLLQRPLLAVPGNIVPR